ncbi:hypothetical protein ACFL6G_06815 [candidate division KSB1 bacterium]
MYANKFKGLSNSLIFTLISLLLIFLTGCSFNPRPSGSKKITGLTKKFPNGKTYFLIYSIPGYFPDDIPVYRSGEVVKIYVYDENNMDIILKTGQDIKTAAETISNEGEKKGWEFEDISQYPEAKNNFIQAKIEYSNSLVDIFNFSTLDGLILKGRKGSRSIECRLLKLSNTRDNYIIQRVRMQEQE